MKLRIGKRWRIYATAPRLPHLKVKRLNDLGLYREMRANFFVRMATGMAAASDRWKAENPKEWAEITASLHRMEVDRLAEAKQKGLI